MEAPLLQAAALLSSLLDAANNPVSLSPEARAALGQLGARLGAVLAAAEPAVVAAATAMDVEGGGDKQELQPQPLRWATTKSGPRDATLRVPYPVMVHIAGFLLPRRNEDKWTDFNALARTSRAWLAATRDDVIWRPLVEGMWGWTQHPPARAAWLKQEQEQGQGQGQGQQGMWVRLYRRLARTAFCLEPGGYRRRWQEDYVISIDIRDTAKGIVLFSESAPLEVKMIISDQAVDCRLGTLFLQEERGEGHVLKGEAVQIMPGFDSLYPEGTTTGITWDRLLFQHPAMQMLPNPIPTQDIGAQAIGGYLKLAARRQELRLDVRLLHLPSGKGATLYSSRNRDPVYVHGVDGSEALALDPLFDNVIVSYIITWKHMRLPTASPFYRASCSNVVNFTAGEGTEATPNAFQAGPEPPEWMRLNRLGFQPGWRIVMDFGEGEHAVPGPYGELDSHRFIHRALQALPWTD